MNQLLQYWIGLSRGWPLPPIGALDPERIPVPWHHCCLVWLGHEKGPRFDHVGGLFADDCGEELTGRPIASTPSGSLLAACTEWVDTVLDNSAPVAFSGVLAGVGAARLECRGALLPFANGDGAVHYLLGTAGYRSCAPAAPLGIQGHVVGRNGSSIAETVAPAA